MRLVRYRTISGEFWGRFDPDGVVPLIGNPFESYRDDSMVLTHREVQLLAPVAPGKIIGVANNYQTPDDDSSTLIEARRASANPVLFLKPPSALVGPGQKIVVPPGIGEIESSGSLALVIGSQARNVSPSDALQYVFGITCANDITAPAAHKAEKHWTRAKGYDSFCPVGPWVCVGEDLTKAVIETYVNLELKSRCESTDMIYSPEELISYISGVMTLNPGDLILTGSTTRVGPLEGGAQVEVRIDRVGSLVNDVRYTV